MRTLILLIFILFATSLVFSQVTPQKQILPQKQAIPSQKEIQGQMQSAIDELNKQIADLEKQIAEAKKNKEDEETIKVLEDQRDMLKKQVEMMGGVKKSVAKIPDKKIQEGMEEESILVPKKDATRISMLPEEILTEAQLSLFIKNVHAEVDRLIPIEEKREALIIYNETKEKYKSVVIVANTASSYWMLGHSEKAVFIMGRVCLDDITNTDNLSNYAAFLIMSGAEHAALPILQYLDKMYSDNSTILNNIGQAWFGLGEIEESKKYLEGVTTLYPNHSMANSALADISLSEGNSSATIAFLKASLKETYDPNKEAKLSKLGYTITIDDMPPLNYPMKNDPLGLLPLLNAWPEEIQTDVNEFRPLLKVQSFVKGVRKLRSQMMKEKRILEQKIREREKKITTNPQYRYKILEIHNSPAHKTASRRLQLRGIKPLSPEKIYEKCEELWHDSVLIPTRKLQTANYTGVNCSDLDEAQNAFLLKRQEIYSRGVRLIKKLFRENTPKYTDWLKDKFYGGSAIDDPPEGTNDLSYVLIGEMEKTMGKGLIENSEHREMLNLINKAGDFQTIFYSSCKRPEIPVPGEDDLAPLIRDKVECDFRKKLKIGTYYSLELVCNTIIEKANVPKRRPKNNQGSASSSRPGRTGGRASSGAPRGPSIYFPEEESRSMIKMLAPLNAEDKDPSQFYLEYDKWGNLIGFNVQLNKEGTGLADPDSVESPIDSRWSWNAIASPKKGFLNKLIIK